jgi:ribosomal-protein-alanine N-acetyltransferase
MAQGSVKQGAHFIIREAAPADLGCVMALESACFNEATRESADVYRERMAVFPEGFLVLEAGEGAPQVRGSICSELWLLGGGPCAPALFSLGHSSRKQHSPSGDALYISSVQVLPGFRGQGAGRALVTELLCRVKEGFPAVRRSVLLVNEAWLPARRLYAALGYREVSRLGGFFSGDAGAKTDGIVMEINLRK